MTEFAGFSVAALDFYDDLEMDNTKSFWESHRHTYESEVAAPMKALMAELSTEFGEAKIFRPYRDVRFAKDKTPYKTAQGAFIAAGPSTGWYIQVAAPGVMVGAGFYDASPARLSSLREAIIHDRHGPELEAILATLQSAGWTLGGDTLKTAPRGYDADHPRITLLRHKSMTLSKQYGFEPFIHTPELLDRVRTDWRELRPLIDWLLSHAKG